MKKIEDIINDNVELFNTEEPLEGHFERFAQKLENQTKNRIKIIAVKLFKAAAILVLVCLSSLWIYDHFFSSNEDKLPTLSKISPEYKEVEEYYLNVINSGYNEIKSYHFQNETHKKMLLDELKNMDSTYHYLQADLKANPTDQRIINAMISHYKLKSEIIEQIICQLQQINNQINTKKHENAEI